jgi:hypothetical protein
VNDWIDGKGELPNPLCGFDVICPSVARVRYNAQGQPLNLTFLEIRILSLGSLKAAKTDSQTFKAGENINVHELNRGTTKNMQKYANSAKA